MNRILKILFFVLIFPIALYVFLQGNRVQNTFCKSKDSKEVAYKHTAIQHWAASNGTKVYFVATEALPIIDIEVDFAAGSSRDGAKPGLSALCTQLLDKGALEWNADQIADKFEDAGVRYNAEIDRDRAIISLRSLTTSEELNAMVALFSNIISNPSFTEESIRVEKEQALIAIKRNLQQPNVIAAQTFYKLIYQNHPYATPSLGTIDGVTSITKADLLQFHQHYFVANNATITIVGSVSESKARELSEVIAKKLVSGNKAQALPEVPSLMKTVDVNIPYHSEQTHILMGQPCQIVGDPDFFPLSVGNYSLGGNVLGSRLFKEIRETRGLAYNVRSSFLQLQKPGPFVIQLQTKNSQTKSAVEVLRTTLLRFIEEGPTEEEFIEAKQGLISAFPLGVGSNAKITDIVSTLGFYNLPLDFLDTYQKRVAAVELQDVKTAFLRRLQPNKMALVIVGTPSD